VEVHPGADAANIRRQWIEKREIGVWSRTYEGGDRRDNRYYQNYDKYIRVWIPGYEDLTQQVASAVIREISSSKRFGAALVGEVGCGTGFLTQWIARWSNAIDLAGMRAIERYICVDTTQVMLDATTAVLDPLNERKRFRTVRGRDFRALRQQRRPGQTYDVVCGSLILHYMLDGAEPADWRRFFDNLDECLAADGSAIFGGCFFAGDELRKEAQLEYWRQEMVHQGLGMDKAEAFIHGNREMCEMPTVDTIGAIAGDTFRLSYDGLGPAKNPFGVLTIRRA
jgi:SAM-dependent methyltransferase